MCLCGYFVCVVWVLVPFLSSQYNDAQLSCVFEKKKEKKKPSQHTPLTVHTFSKSSSPMVEFFKKKT